MPENPNLFFEDSNDFIQHKINQARQRAEHDLAEKEASRAENRKKARDIAASIFEEAADIALEGIEQPKLDNDTCYAIAGALKLQAALIRGDVNE